MSLKIVRLYGLVCFLALAVGPLRAQDTAQPQNPPSATETQQAPGEHPKHHMHMMGGTTVTGCLQKGEEANEYSITGEDGKKYGLKSTKVNLSEHVGHKVTVTGKVRKESAAEKKEPGGEAADLTVTKLQMISEKCP